MYTFQANLKCLFLPCIVIRKDCYNVTALILLEDLREQKQQARRNLVKKNVCSKSPCKDKTAPISGKETTSGQHKLGQKSKNSNEELKRQNKVKVGTGFVVHAVSTQAENPVSVSSSRLLVYFKCFTSRVKTIEKRFL